MAQEIVDKAGKRGITTEEEAMLAHRIIAVKNEMAQRVSDVNAGKIRDFSDRALKKWNDRGPELTEQYLTLDRAAHLAGSEGGRMLAFRRQMLRYDYSLGNLIGRATAADPKTPLSQDHSKALQAASEKIKDLEAKIAKAEESLAKTGKVFTGEQSGESGSGSGSGYEALDGLRIQSNQAKADAERIINSRSWQAKPPTQRALDWLRKIRVAMLISSPTTNLRIAASSAVRTFEPAIDNVIGAGLRLLPGIREVAEKAPLHGRGFDLAIEAAALKYAAENSPQAMKDYVRTGKSSLDLLHGSERETAPRTWLDFVGDLHAAEKAPATLAAYQRTKLLLEKAAAERGEAMTPQLHDQIGRQAYEEYQRAKFQADHALTDYLDRFINNAKRHENAGVRTLGHIADQLVPIRKIPTNIVLENFERLMGVPMGLGKIGIAKAKGVEITPQQADVIMRQLKKGSLGLAAIALGYFGYQGFGGLYSGRRRPDELQPGEVDTSLGKIPNWATAHQPLFAAAHFGAAIRRERDKIEVHHAVGERVGTPTAVVRSMGAMLEEVPYLREQRDVGQLLKGNVGPLARSYAIPALLNEVARRQDTREGTPFGTPNRRQAVGVGQNIQSGIPQIPGVPWVPHRTQLPLSR